MGHETAPPSWGGSSSGSTCAISQISSPLSTPPSSSATASTLSCARKQTPPMVSNSGWKPPPDPARVQTRGTPRPSVGSPGTAPSPPRRSSHCRQEEPPPRPRRVLDGAGGASSAMGSSPSDASKRRGWERRSLRRVRPRARRRLGRDGPCLCSPLPSPGHPAARGPNRLPPPTWPRHRAPPSPARAVAGGGPEQGSRVDGAGDGIPPRPAPREGGRGGARGRMRRREGGGRMLHGLAEGAGSRERGAPLGSSRPALRRPETLVRAPWLSRWAKGGGGRRGSRPGRARGPVAARREEARRGGSGPRGGEGRPREGGDPWPPRSGGGRRPEREAERERDAAMLAREDTKGVQEASDGRREPSDGESDGRK